MGESLQGHLQFTCSKIGIYAIQNEGHVRCYTGSTLFPVVRGLTIPIEDICSQLSQYIIYFSLKETWRNQGTKTLRFSYLEPREAVGIKKIRIVTKSLNIPDLS